MMHRIEERMKLLVGQVAEALAPNIKGEAKGELQSQVGDNSPTPPNAVSLQPIGSTESRDARQLARGS
jgi:hypothetical protein